MPRGDEYYAWALRAGTTTRMTPDEIHELGKHELEQLHARMDAILREIGLSTGSVGERMQALAKDPRYKFAEGDPGRAEIVAFITHMNVFAAKVLFGCWVFIWARWTLPRFRYDQLMNLGWRYMLPLAAVNVLLAGAWIALTRNGAA